MPRTSRHKSHRPHKHSSRDARERSDSEDEGASRERKQPREERVAAVSGARVSRDLEPEKRKSSSLSQPSQGKELSGSGNGDFSGDHGKKRKDRPADSAATADRWNGGDVDGRMDDKESKGGGFGQLDSEMAKAKILAIDAKGRSSRKREGSSERKEESASKDDSAKRRSEKESSRRESSVQYKDAKGRDRERGPERDREQRSERDRERVPDRDRENWLEKERGRGSEREKKGQDFTRERSDHAASGKAVSRTTGGVEEDRIVKRDLENTEWQIQDELRNPELEKELVKRIRRDGSGDKDKWQGDDRDGEDKRSSSKGDNTKNDSCRGEKLKDGRYRDKYREDAHREQRHREDKQKDDHSSRDRTSNRSDNKHYRDENKVSENRYKKSKHQDSDHDGSPYADDCGTKYKDNRGRKRSSDGNDDHSDLKSKNAKEPRVDLDRTASNNYKIDSSSDRGRPEHIHLDKVDSTLSNSRAKSSPSSSAQIAKDEYRLCSKQVETTRRNSSSEERLRSSRASSGDLVSASVIRERVSEPRPVEKRKPRDDPHSAETIDGHGSPIQLTENSPSSTSDRRHLNRNVSRHSLDVEEIGQRSSGSKDGRYFSANEDREREFPMGKPAVDDRSQADLLNTDSVPAGLSSFNRTDHFSSSSPSQLPPPPPVRLGIDSPSVLGSFEEDNRVQAGDRKSSSRYKRNGDLNMGRGQGNAWKGVPNWSSPVTNGFIPFQHGPPPGGFHTVVQQFPGPSLFGVRPSMDLNHTGVSYHMHETPDRFSNHARPFGWRNPADDSLPPHLQGWDGNNSVFGDESHVYGKPDWEHNRHLIGSRGWEMSADMWKGQNGNLNMEFPVPHKEAEYSTRVPADETWIGRSAHRHRSEWSRSERFPAESIEIKRSEGTPSAKNAVEASPKIVREKTPEPSKSSNDDGALFYCTYLSKLDISVDLARPELYKQCLSLLGTGDTTMSGPKVTKHLYPHQQDIKVVVKNNHSLSSLFPARTDAIFQRAMSLYKKHNEEMKTQIPQLFLQAKERDSPRNSALEEMKPLENLAHEDTSQAKANPPSNMEEDSDFITDAKCDLPSDAMEQQSDTISNVFVEGSSEAREVLMPECRVNLSRIHHSPENTH